MSLINSYIEIINSQLKTKIFNDKKFSGCLIGGIAKLVYTRVEESNVVIPGSIDADGNETNYSIDDNFTLQSYHKIVSKQYLQPAANRQYGSNVMQQQVITAYMVFFSSFGKIKMTAEDLECLISRNFPGQIQKSTIANNAAIKSMSVVLQNSNMDSLSVFNREYQNVRYELGAEDILFSMQYQITALINKSCLNDCDPCNG